MSQALLTLSQRVVGDIPAPPVAAAIHDAIHSWRNAGNIIICFLAISMICYLIGFLTSHNARDYRAEYEAEGAGGEENGEIAGARRGGRKGMGLRLGRGVECAAAEHFRQAATLWRLQLHNKVQVQSGP